MHLTFDCINGVEPPMTLPPSLVPPNKSHLLGSIQAQPTGVYPQPTGIYPQQTGYHSSPGMGGLQPQPTGLMPQQTGYSTQYQQHPQYTANSPQYIGYTQSAPATPEFSWDMTSDDMTSYQNIYSKYANDTGKVKCKAAKYSFNCHLKTHN